MLPRCFLISGLLALTACSHLDQPHLTGRWIITDIINQSSLTQHTPWLHFSDGELHGHSGCNSFSGAYHLEKNSLIFSALASSRKLCAGPEMEQERALFKLLSQRLTIKPDKRNLQLLLDQQQVLLLSGEQ